MSDELWIGVPDGKIDAGTTTAAALYENRIGGQPVWMFSDEGAASEKTLLKCPNCGSSDHVSLLSQMLCPQDCWDRILYSLVCRKCAADMARTAASAAATAANKSGGGGKKRGGASADETSSPMLQVPPQFVSVCGSKSPVFVLRAQNYNKSYEKEDVEEKGEGDDDEKNKEATFQVDDDWGDDDDDDGGGGGADKKPAVVAPSEETNKKKNNNNISSGDDDKKSKKPEDPTKVTLPVSCSVGKTKRPFAEYQLDIYAADEDDDDEDWESDDEGDTPAASGKSGAAHNLSAAEKAKIQAQLAAIKEKFPNADIDESAFFGGAPKSSAADKNNQDAKKNPAAAAAAAAEEDEEENREIAALAAAAKQVDFPQWETFLTKIGSEPRQVVRWQPGGFPVSALEHGALPGNPDRKVQSDTAGAIMEQAARDTKVAGTAYQLLLKTEVPPCERCGAPRRFEFQLVSPLIFFLTGGGDGGGADAADELSFATAMVFTCSKSCPSTSSSLFSREFVLLQNEPVVTSTAELQQNSKTVAKK